MRLSPIDWTNPALITRFALAGCCLIAAALWPQAAPVALFLLLGVLLSLLLWFARAARSVDARILALLPGARGWRVHLKAFPLYKAVDIVQATRRLLEADPRCITLEATVEEPLFVLLGQRRNLERPLRKPAMVARPDGPDSEQFLAGDGFWLVRPGGADGKGPCIVRVRVQPQFAQAVIEVAAPDTPSAERLIEAILTSAGRHSVYRDHMLRVTFGPTTGASYDDEDSMAPMDIAFLREPPVTEESIVLEDVTRRTLEHAVIDFHQRRDDLMRLGVPGKRGVLFYGPPGTGKTYTCRHLAHRLAPVTTLVATGHALLRMQEICALAAMLQPSLVLLEDVDLVFSSRELNAHNTVLGEFMDQLDGFGSQHHVIFVLTTNAIERVEAAIKDRPGRISQCIYFGPPGPVLRRRYLEHQLRAYPRARLNLAAVVAQTEGVSQAFLKELVYRSVQIASADRPADEPAAVELDDRHVHAALEEMLDGAGQAGKRIIGFRIEA
jgi:hypothetical protein